MMGMTLPVIATIYLDKTKQWADVGFHKREEALRHIRTGRLTQIQTVQATKHIDLLIAASVDFANSCSNSQHWGVEVHTPYL